MGGEVLPVGEQFLNASAKISETLASYFRLKIEKSCAKLRSLDPEGFDAIIQRHVDKFKRNSMDQVTKLIEEMDISKKAQILNEANTNCVVDRPWRPSGNPEEDTNALVYEMHKEHRDMLVAESSRLYGTLRHEVAELNSARQAQLRSLRSLEDLAAILKNA